MSKQRAKEQVREVKSKINEIKKLTKELTLPPEVTQPNEDIVSQINNAIVHDKSLEALKDNRDVEALKQQKANIELPDIEVDINTLTFNDKPVVEEEVKETKEDKVVDVDIDLESFFDSCDGFF